MVNIFMDDLLGEGEYIRGKSEVKTLRLSGEKRKETATLRKSSDG